MDWIGIEDESPPLSDFRPPDQGKSYPRRVSVIVATAEGRVFETTYTRLGFANLNSRTDHVTHWMPMPKHPRA